MKKLETLRDSRYQDFPVCFPLPACSNAVFQQNLQIEVIAVISHHDLATNSCLRFSACFVQSHGHKVIFLP